MRTNRFLEIQLGLDTGGLPVPECPKHCCSMFMFELSFYFLKPVLFWTMVSIDQIGK
jgi:hypothetical protein